jgi:NAD(P)-dependent dehydrogenase (short-subunit alcohol dehydrogenase family)
MTMQPLSNQRILVIGGSSGIGFATAAAAVGAGAALTIASRIRKKLETAAAKLWWCRANTSSRYRRQQCR